MVRRLKWIALCIVCTLGMVPLPNTAGAAVDAVEAVDHHAALFSLRLIDSDYTGPLVQVRRSADNATIDLYADAGGELDLQELRQFTGESSGYVSIWYDQSGGAADAVQTVAALQPMLVSEGVVQQADGRPAIYFDEDNELALASLSVPAPLSINFVGRTTFGNGSRYIFDPNGAELYRWNVAPASNELRTGNAGHMMQLAGLDFRESFVSTAVINGESSSLSLNGTTVSGNMGTAGLTNTATIGSNTVGVGLVGYVQEVLVFADALTGAERSAIEAEQIARYLTPGNVRKLKVSAAGSQAELNWSAPLSSYAPITGFKIEYKEAGSDVWLLHDTTILRTSLITGLADGTWYDFRVRAVNEYGTGLSSDVWSRRLGQSWGTIADASAASNVIASTLIFPGVPAEGYASVYTAQPLAAETGFQEADIRLQLQRMKSIGINAVQISFFGADTLGGSKYLPMNAWRNRTDGQIFEDYDRLIACIEQEGMYFYPLIETSSAMPFYVDFGVSNTAIVERIGYWAERWGDSPSWLKLYNREGEARSVVSFIEAVKFAPYAPNLFESNLADIVETVAGKYDLDIGFALDPTRLPEEGDGGLAPGAYGPKPADLSTSADVLLIHPWEITVDGSDDEERTRWATQFLKAWNDAGYPTVSFVVGGYDASGVFPASDVYGKTAEWRELQKTLAIPALGSAGITFGPWNGWTEWFHVTLSQGAGGDDNLLWAKESIAVNRQRGSAKPGYVEQLAGTGVGTSLHLAWEAPVSSGGKPVTDYKVAYRVHGTGTWLAWADGVSAVPGAIITGLAANTLYDVQVAAVNANGDSAGATVVTVGTP